MPTLINKIQDRQNIAKWKREYSIISNAFQVAYNEGIPICDSYGTHGDCVAVYLGNMSDEFRERMVEQLNVVDYCTVSGEKGCDYFNRAYQEYSKYKWSGFANIYSRYKALGSKVHYPDRYSEYGINSESFNDYAYLLNDGAVVYFGGRWYAPWIVVDVNNFTHGPNEFGRDVFAIRIFSNTEQNEHWAKPMGAEGTFEKSIYGDTCGCSKDVGTETGLNLINGGRVIAGICCSAYYLYAK